MSNLQVEYGYVYMYDRERNRIMVYGARGDIQAYASKLLWRHCGLSLDVTKRAETDQKGRKMTCT